MAPAASIDRDLCIMRPLRSSKEERKEKAEPKGAATHLYVATGFALIGCAVFAILHWLATRESLYLLLTILFVLGAGAIILERPGTGPPAAGEREFGLTALGVVLFGLGRIDIYRSQIMAAARWAKPVKWMVRRS